MYNFRIKLGIFKMSIDKILPADSVSFHRKPIV